MIITVIVIIGGVAAPSDGDVVVIINSNGIRVGVGSFGAVQCSHVVQSGGW
jgi:pyridoxal biosynthesis lyase PdxS